jgi:predicted transcriptional regulator
MMNNTVSLPQSLIKRLEKITAGSRRTPDAIVKQAVKNQLDYEEWFVRQVEAGIADEKSGRVYSKDEFWTQLDKARHERKKAA